VIGVLDIVDRLPANPEAPHNQLQTLSLVATIAIWAFCILEPIVTFWTAAHDRPAVEKARLRAISIGYAGLFAVVILGLLSGALNAGVSPVLDLSRWPPYPSFTLPFPAGMAATDLAAAEEDQFRTPCTTFSCSALTGRLLRSAPSDGRSGSLAAKPRSCSTRTARSWRRAA
jgi:hypothetical protein